VGELEAKLSSQQIAIQASAAEIYRNFGGNHYKTGKLP